MSGTGNGQKLRQPLYNSKNQCLQSDPKIHQSPKERCTLACPDNIFTFTAISVAVCCCTDSARTASTRNGQNSVKYQLGFRFSRAGPKS
ncbi:hypothetical protein EMIT0P260_30331 [Pseudomonas sp. IT-P260]